MATRQARAAQPACPHAARQRLAACPSPDAPLPRAHLPPAAEALLAAAIRNPRNQKFLILSESDLPLYSPEVLYQQVGNTICTVLPSGDLHGWCWDSWAGCPAFLPCTGRHPPAACSTGAPPRTARPGALLRRVAWHGLRSPAVLSPPAPAPAPAADDGAPLAAERVQHHRGLVPRLLPCGPRLRPLPAPPPVAQELAGAHGLAGLGGAGRGGEGLWEGRVGSGTPAGFLHSPMCLFAWGTG